MATQPTKDFLDIAGSAEFRDIARFLAHDPGAVKRRGGNRTTPLHHAVFEDHAEVAALIIDYGVDINARDDINDTALAWATNMQSPDSVRLLLERGADWTLKDSKGLTPLELALQRREKDDGKNPETTAKNDQIIEALEQAAEGKTVIVPPSPVEGERKLKLDFVQAAAEGDSQTFNDILHHHPEAATWVEPASKVTALFNIVATAALPPEDAARLLANGADVNVADLQGWTPLACAAMGEEHGAYLDLLIAAKADAFARDKWGRTPAMIAEINKNPDRDKILSYEERYADIKREESVMRDIGEMFHGAPEPVTVGRPLRFKMR